MRSRRSAIDNRPSPSIRLTYLQQLRAVGAALQLLRSFGGPALIGKRVGAQLELDNERT
jgi:hypothetical protein